MKSFLKKIEVEFSTLRDVVIDIDSGYTKFVDCLVIGSKLVFLYHVAYPDRMTVRKSFKFIVPGQEVPGEHVFLCKFLDNYSRPSMHYLFEDVSAQEVFWKTEEQYEESLKLLQ